MNNSNKELVDYIAQQLQSGTDKATIRGALIAQGWTETDINAAFQASALRTTPEAKKKINLFFWKKEEQENGGAFAPNEEFNAKRTSTLGYLFLILMVIFGVWQGNNFLSSLENVITPPQQNSSCLSILSHYAGSDNYSGENYFGGYYNNQTGAVCNFSEREIKLSIAEAYKNFEPTLTAIGVAEKNISNLNNEINSANYNRGQTVTNYQVSLIEDIAKTQEKAFDSEALQTGIISQDSYLAKLRSTLAQEESRKQSLLNDATKVLAPFKDAMRQAVEGYNHDNTVYQFKQFLLGLIFIAPLFFFIWRRYHASKNARSEYAVIWGGLVATVGIIFAQVILVFVYEILPQEILQRIFAILAKIKIIWAILYWLSFILVPLFFGYLIFLIQKKVYNKRAVLMRAIKSGHCPQCSLKVSQIMNHCPVCGYALKTKCVSCGAMSVHGGSYCDICGVKKI